jgi:ABC-2 type transport system ATP-binding protein
MPRTALAALVALIAASAPLSIIPAAGADPQPYVQVAVHIPATYPDDEGKPVFLDGAVEIPTSGCPCPAILINHGFLGQWQDNSNVADLLARHGYVVLRYSSRGFGNTPGEVDLVGPKETQDLLDAVHFLNDEKIPELVGKVIHDDIGQWGASYGGGQAWALAASGDPAVRTVVPTDTWTDFYQALLPNDVLLLTYVNGFYVTGYDPTAWLVNGATSGNPSGAKPNLTQNYSQELHRWIAEANTGADVGDLKSGLDARSVMYRIEDIHIPVFIVQGSNDGLFSENQALAAYQALTARGIPARLYVGGLGHPPSNGSTSSPEAVHVEAEILAWFDHYLKGSANGIDQMPPIEYSYTTYFNNHWDGTTRSAYRYPFGPAQRLYLCTTGPTGGSLSAQPCPAAPPEVAVSTPNAGGYDQEPVTAGDIKSGLQQLTGCGQGAPTCQQSPPDLDSPASVLTYDAAPVGSATYWAGLPRLDLQVGAVDELPAGVQGGAAAFQLDPKLYDVAPDGSATLITRGAFAEPLNASATGSQTIPRHPVSYDMFGLSYLLRAGHHLRLTLSTSDAPYLRPTANPFGVALFTGSELSLPTTSAMFPTPPLGQPGPSVPESGLPALLGFAGAVSGLAAMGWVARRRRSRKLPAA